MAALRKLSIFAVLLLTSVLFSGMANAQPLTLGTIQCVVGAVPPLVRAEGIAELVGDITFNCTNTEPAAGGVFDPTVLVNVSVSLNVNVTNDIDFGEGDDITTAVVVINENNCGAPTAVGGIEDYDDVLPGGCAPPDRRYQIPQYGELASNNRLEWNGVVFPVPGGPAPDFIDNGGDPGTLVAGCETTDGGDPGAAPDCNPATTVMRVSSIRANASQLGVPAIEGVPFSQVTAFISITGESTLNLSENVRNVAIPLTGLIVDIDEDDAAAGLQCDDEDSGHVEFQIREGFATAFKTLGVPTFAIGGLVQVENAYPAPGSGADTDPGDGGAINGGATQATRFLLRFFNIPEGVNVCVLEERDCADDEDFDGLLTGDDDDTDELELIALDCDEVGDSCDDAETVDGDDVEDLCGDAADGLVSDVVQVDIDGGFGSIVYEVLDDDPIANEDCNIPVWFGWTPDTENNLPAPGTGQLAVTFAPLSTVGTASEGEPEPRFIDTGGDPTNVITIVKCTTTILWPFVTNRFGFDTGIVISNTSEDWLGTNPQDGACTLHWHGTTLGDGASPPDDTTCVLEAGEQLIFLLSTGNAACEVDPVPEFQGYLISVCEFQFGHGYAFITDGFGSVPTLAQGYLALILEFDSDGDRCILTNTCAGGAESLDQ